MSDKKRVAVLGKNGKMGTQAVKAVEEASDMDLVAALGSKDSLDELVDKNAEIIVDLTSPESTVNNVQFAVSHDISAVVGTTGWGQAERDQLSKELQKHPKVGVLIAPNFGIGSILETKFAAMAAPYYDSVEIIELHHPQKVDAPSGTAIRTAEEIARIRDENHMPAAPDATQKQIEGARGAKIEDIPVHAVRLQGLVAHQEVIFGADGEGLTLRHDSYDRKAFMPGVLLGIRQVQSHPGLSYGLDSYMDL